MNDPISAKKRGEHEGKEQKQKTGGAKRRWVGCGLAASSPPSARAPSLLSLPVFTKTNAS